MSKLLSICIPTYNRAEYLKLSLGQFCKQMDSFVDNVEILVVDNHSTDNTKDIVTHFQQQFSFVSYHRHDSNIGADGNFYWCFKHAMGKFIWIFGDDDVILDKKLKVIIELLTTINPHLIYLSGYAYSGDNYLVEAPKNKPVLPKPNIEFYLSKEKYLKKVHYNITFTTANIVNKSVLAQNLNYESFVGLNLIHTCWIFETLITGNNFAVINEKIYAAKTNNSGGYKLFETFSKNFNLIINYFVHERKMNLTFKKTIQFNLLLSFFPHFIIESRFKKNNTFSTENPEFILKSEYGKNIWFYMFIYPLF